MSKKYSNAEQKERIRQRVRVQIDEENYQFFPERKDPDYYDNDVNQRVGVYVRVSTDDPRQTTSYELQKKYYEDFVVRHPKWTLVDIYADEGISGTSTKHRDEFNRMIAECKVGKIDLIITKSVSRFARNVVDFLGMVRMLSERTPPIGVFFEAENIFSLNETSNMALSFQATMAEEESRNKSRSMETSLRMRLDHGLPLTPKLLGFTHDSEGKVSRRDGTNFVFDGQHTIEAVALKSGSRDTPVWCMIFDHLSYEHEAHIFAEQQKHHRPVSPYDTFYAHLESGSEKHLLIRDLVYSYDLELGSTQKRHGVICAIAALENIFDTYGYHVLDKVLRILVSTWEGEIYSLTGNMLNAVARMLAAYGDALNEETFKERLGLIPMKTIIRTARERRPGALGYAEAMLLFYNKKCKYRLSMRKLYGTVSDEDDLDDDEDSDSDE